MLHQIRLTFISCAFFLFSIIIADAQETNKFQKFYNIKELIGKIFTDQINFDSLEIFIGRKNNKITAYTFIFNYGTASKACQKVTDELMSRVAENTYPEPLEGCPPVCLGLCYEMTIPFKPAGVLGLAFLKSGENDPANCRREKCTTTKETFPCPTEKDPDKICAKTKEVCEWICDENAMKNSWLGLVSWYRPGNVFR